jgi:pimeloyl-ACP methyl ester carboxylesterase
VALVAAAGAREAVVVGHDWGALIAWAAALFRPDLFRAVACLSVPFRPRGPAPPLQTLRAAGQHGFYQLYFQQPGVAEAEFERDAAATLRRILYSGSGDRPPRGSGAGLLTVPEGGGFLTSTIDPPVLPPWLGEDDLRFMAGEFARTGFAGGLNYYRNIDRNWALTAPWQGAAIRQPALYIGGTRDPVILTPMGKAALEAMPRHVPGLRASVMLEGCGHWTQQERPAEVNQALLEFLGGLRAGMA